MSEECFQFVPYSTRGANRNLVCILKIASAKSIFKVEKKE